MDSDPIEESVDSDPAEESTDSDSIEESTEVKHCNWIDPERFLENIQRLRLKTPVNTPPRYKFTAADLDITNLKYDLKIKTGVTLNQEGIEQLNDKIKFNVKCGKSLMLTLSRVIFTLLDSEPIPEALPHLLKSAVRAQLHEDVETFAEKHNLAIYRRRAARETNILIREACPNIETLNEAEIRLIADMDPQETGSQKPWTTPNDLWPFYDSRRRKLLPIFMLKRMGLDVAVLLEEVIKRGRMV